MNIKPTLPLLLLSILRSSRAIIISRLLLETGM